MKARAARCWSWLAVLAACGGDAVPLPAVDLSLRVEADVGEVEFGTPFELRTVGVWRADLEPEPIDDRSLLPLEVELVATERAGDGVRLQEVRRYRARAFAVGRNAVAPVSWRAFPRAGGAPVGVTSPEFAIEVRSALPAGAAGQPEGPGGLLPLPGRTIWPMVFGALAVAAVAIAFAAGRRRRPTSAATAAPAVEQRPSRERALRDLDAIERDAAEAPLFCIAIAAVLRGHAAAVLDLATATMTTEELSAAGRHRLAPAAWAPLDASLQRCDLVKFARAPLPAAQRAQLLAAARAFVQATCEAEP